MKGNSLHHSRKVLDSNFISLWQKLKDAGEQYLITPKGHKFSADAFIGTKGTHEQQKFVRIKHNGQEFARIYPCCWGHTTNCYGTRIGGYSSGLDLWYKGLMISVESLTLKPRSEVIHDFDKLLNSQGIDYEQALKFIPKEPGTYLVYDKKQRKYIYIGNADDLRKRIQQHAQRQSQKSRFHNQQIQKGLITKKRCHTSDEAQKYLHLNCTVKYAEIPDEKERKYPWIRRSLLEHYAISVIEPEYNILNELQS